MPKSVADKIRERVLSYVLGRCSPVAFEDWFTPIAWSIEKTGDWAARELVYQISTLLAEFSNGDRTEDSLRNELLALISVVETPTQRRSFSESRLIVSPPAAVFSSPSVCRRLSQQVTGESGTRFVVELGKSFVHLGKYQTTTTQAPQLEPQGPVQRQRVAPTHSLQTQLGTLALAPACSTVEFSRS